MFSRGARDSGGAMFAVGAKLPPKVACALPMTPIYTDHDELSAAEFAKLKALCLAGMHPVCPHLARSTNLQPAKHRICRILSFGTFGSVHQPRQLRLTTALVPPF